MEHGRLVHYFLSHRSAVPGSMARGKWSMSRIVPSDPTSCPFPLVSREMNRDGEEDLASGLCGPGLMRSSSTTTADHMLWTRARWESDSCGCCARPSSSPSCRPNASLTGRRGDERRHRSAGARTLSTSDALISSIIPPETRS